MTAGCADLVVSLIPERCGLTCNLEYQGYGRCDVTQSGVVCFSCSSKSAPRIISGVGVLLLTQAILILGGMS